MSRRWNRKSPKESAAPESRKAKGVRSRLGTGERPVTYIPLPTQGAATATSKAAPCSRYTRGERTSIEIR